MKELTIKRTIQVKQFEPVTFEATFERGFGILGHTENTEALIVRSFTVMGMIIKRAGLQDKIPWVNPIGQRDPATKEDLDDLKELADKIDEVLEENDK